MYVWHFVNGTIKIKFKAERNFFSKAHASRDKNMSCVIFHCDFNQFNNVRIYRKKHFYFQEFLLCEKF